MRRKRKQLKLTYTDADVRITKYIKSSCNGISWTQKARGQIKCVT